MDSEGKQPPGELSGETIREGLHLWAVQKESKAILCRQPGSILAEGPALGWGSRAHSEGSTVVG